MQYKYKTKGTCSRSIEFEVDENDIVKNVKFKGGCSGNLKGLSKLTEGLNSKEVIKRLSGITCGFRKTSCPDQLSKALKSVIYNKGE